MAMQLSNFLIESRSLCNLYAIFIDMITKNILDEVFFFKKMYFIIKDGHWLS